MKKIVFILFLSLAAFIFSEKVSATNSQTDWPMVGADPQRTSHNGVEVRGPFNPAWTRPIDPYIDNKVQAIAADNKIFVSTSKGVYAFNASDGSFAWNNLSDPCKCYGTEMPIGNSVTYFNGVLYAPGFDHKIHAINANNGTKLSGWNLNNFDLVGAGFDTSPLVISDSSTGNKPLVLIGNRDGKFYAIDGETGAVKWSFSAVAPIKYSAAYKNGVVYFGDDASFAYALNVSTGSLKWKSAKFKGVGFDAYWPVIYTDTTVSPAKDWVIFTGSLKSSWVWFVGNRKTVEEINENTVPCTQTSGVSYIWPAGSTIFDCSKISNWMKANPDDHISYVLDPQTGLEKTDVYAPFNPAPHDGGAQGYKQPPVVGGNNVLYTLIGTESGGNGGATNTFFGWKFGTPFVARVTNNSEISAASDEPRAITSGGNLLYYGEGFNHEFWGAMETNKATGSNASWIWDSRSAAGANAKYSQLTLEGKFCGSASTCQSGSYSYFDGLQNLSPIPYGGKLYYIMGNVLVAMNSGSGANTGLGLAPAPQIANQVPADLTPGSNNLKQKLETEVQKIIDVYSQSGKILRPGYFDSHHVSGSMVFGSAFVPYYIPGEHMADYFHLPSDTVTTLVNAYPFLSSALQSSVKSYLQNMFGPGKTYDVSSVAHIGWNSGPRREWGEDTPVMTATLNGSNGLDFYLNKTPQTSITGQNERLNVGSFPPEAFYGAWKYAKLMNEQGLMTTAQVKTMFNSMSSKLVNPGSGNDLTSANLSKYPYLHNQVLTGYYGYLQLEKLAGNTSNITQSSKYSQYQSLLNSRVANFSDITWFADNDIFINVLNSAGNWMFLAPEVLNELKSSNRAGQIQTVLNHAQLSEPFWFVSKYNRSFSESYNRPLYDYPSMFQANAYFSGLNQTQLAKFLDVPAFEKGDLYYIQNLTAALEAPGGVVVTPPPTPSSTPVPSPTPAVSVGGGDADGNGILNALDLRAVLANYLKAITTALNQYSDSKMNAFDFVAVLKRLPIPTPSPSENPTPTETATPTLPPGNNGTPRGGEMWSVPGTIQFEDFNDGGEGVAYHDLSAANSGGKDRTGEGVDVEVTPDGSGSQFHVGWASPGEWLKYTVDVKQSGKYDLMVRVQQTGGASGGKFHIEVDNVNVTGTISPSIGVWLGYSSPTISNIALTKGSHVVKLVMDSTLNQYVGNFNWMHFELVDPAPSNVPVVVSPVGQNPYYVSPSGNDSNSGSISNPWKTLTKAANTLTKGQSVYVRAGTYKERLVPKNSGEENNYIVFSAYPNESVTIDGTGIQIPQLEGLVSVDNKSFIRVTGFNVINSGVGVSNGKWNMGISAVNSHHVVIDNNFVSHIYSIGIDLNLFANHVLVDGNRITDTNFGSDDDDVALGIAWYSHHVEVSDNLVYDTKNEGIDPVAGAHDIKIHNNTVHHQNKIGNCRIGIYIDAWTEHEYNIDVYNNVSRNNCGDGIAVSSEGGGLMENVNIFNNVVHGNTGSGGGIGIVPWSTTTSQTHPIRNVNIVNNTVYANPGGGIVINNPEARQIVVRNNIVFQNGGPPIVVNSQIPSGSVVQSNNLTTNPNFVNPSGGDFHLQAGSPAINAGSSTQFVPAFDFDNKPRPNGSGFDIGAFEF